MEICKVCSGLRLNVEAMDEDYLGTYEEIVQRSQNLAPGRGGCPGCALFCNILHGSDYWRSGRSELSGRLVFLRWLRLDVREPSKADHGRWAADDLLLELCSEEGTQDPNPDIDSLRPVPVDPRHEQCYELIKSWLNQCSNHEHCAPLKPVDLPRRIIEVPVGASHAPKLRLTDGELGQYVILSHCWGDSEVNTLKDSLIPQFQKEIAVDLLPRNIMDAIHITRRLGFRFLWIDALCISQDSPADWAEESSKLAYYYGQAALVISADNAKDANEGILTDREVFDSPVFGSGENRYCLRPRVLRQAQDIRRSPLANRGWAAQERMLGPRIVHYTRRQLVWECGTGLQFEASGIGEKKFGSKQVDLNFRKEKFQPIVTEALRSLRPENAQAELEDITGGERETSPVLARIRAWHQCVDDYAGRSLTQSDDKLRGLSSVASIVNYDGAMGEYLAGIWSKGLAAGLDWGRPWALLSSPSQYRAPSWSWASLDGKIDSHFLSSPPELLQPPADGVGPAMAAKYDLRLIECGMNLQSTAIPYGPVMEGSYIIVEGACITMAQLLKLTNVLQENRFRGPIVVLDKSSLFDCPCCGPPDSKKTESGDDSDRDANASRNHKNAAHFDLCMFLLGNAWLEAPGFVDTLLLRWVDQEQKTAERVGTLRLSFWREEEMEAFNRCFDGGGWERLTMKLV